MSGGDLVITGSMMVSMGVGTGASGLAVGAVVCAGVVAVAGLITWAVVKRWQLKSAV